MLGRVHRIRKHGRICFLDVFVEGSILNCYIDENTNNYDEVCKLLFRGACVALGDITPSKNKNGQTLLLVKDVQLKSKSLRFPDQYPKNEIKDIQIIIKNRTLHYLTNIEAYHNLIKRSHILGQIRGFFRDLGALEVDLPVLQSSFGGAFAKPFCTHANHNKKDYFLRVSLEFPLKRLIIAGIPQVFSLGPCFRNESLDSTHTFEYTHFEYYTTKHTYKQVQRMVEKLYRDINYNHNLTYFKHEFDLRNPWPVYDKKHIDELLKNNKAKNIDQLIESKVLGPFFHIEGCQENPLAIMPYIFDSYIDYDMELTTGYMEQNDAHKLSTKPKLTQILDDEFLKDLAYGMHNAIGLGLGVDRLVKSVLNKKTLREIQVFPHI